MQTSRRDFLLGGAAVAVGAVVPPVATLADAQQPVPPVSVPVRRSEELESELIAKWDKATEAVANDVYEEYLLDGNTRGLKALEANALAFEKVMREAKATVVTGDVPAIWSVYNMGYIVKTRESLFAIDLNHRRGTEFAPMLDFALITHNHRDHWRKDFYDAMTEQGKIGAGGLTVSNAYDVTIAKGLAGAGGLVKKGDGALTLSGPNTFTGGIDVQAGALAIAGDASFANTMLNMADGTTLKVKFSPGSGFATSNIVLALDANTQGSVAIEIDLSTGMPEPNRVYTLFAPGLNAATLNRLSIDPAFSPAFSENGALTLTFSPKIHAWMGGGADAKWTTAANWNISDPVVTYDHVVFSGISGYSIYDCADGLRLASITAGFGVHTANVETACFANVPITVAGGATFALENASGVTNAFSTVANTNVIAGVLDLGGAAQTISTTMAGNDAGSFRDGGEIRNGALTLISSTEQNLNNTAFTFGSGSRVSSSSRIYLQYGAHLTIDGGTYTNTFTGNNHVIGANSGVSTLEVSNGGCFVAKRPWFIGHTANGSLIGDGGIIDVGAQPLYLSNQNAAQSVLALTNAVLTCGEIQFAYSTSGGNTQTLILKNSLVNLSSFLFRHKTAASSILFDGATLVPKAASASFIPTGLPTPVLGAGGLIISNAFDVSVAVGMTGEGGIVKKGNAKLTVTDNQSFGGDVIVSNGTFTTSSEFAGGLRAMSDATIDVADAMFGGDIVIEDGVALTATNGVDWATTKFVPIAKTTANASYPSRANADGRHFFVRQQGGVQTLCYGRKAGLVIMMR